MKYRLTVHPRLVKVTSSGYKGKSPRSKRGEVKGFSGKSRRRLIEMMLKATRPPDFFITLTVQEPVADEVFRTRFRYFMDTVITRDKGNVFILWRLEKQKRGVLHAHMLLWKKAKYRFCKRWPVLKYAVFNDWVENFKPVDLSESRWVLYHGIGSEWEDVLTYFSVKWCGLHPRSWEEANRAVDVKEVRSFEAAAKYVSKYVAKIPEEDRVFKGRVWGYRGNRELPGFRTDLEVVFSDEQRQILTTILKDIYLLYGKDYAGVVVERFPRGGSVYMETEQETESLVWLVQEYMEISGLKYREENKLSGREEGGEENGNGS